VCRCDVGCLCPFILVTQLVCVCLYPVAEYSRLFVDELWECVIFVGTVLSWGLEE
jgi:hypothetical protein